MLADEANRKPHHVQDDDRLHVPPSRVRLFGVSQCIDERHDAQNIVLVER
jgi:hypothetical protein